MRELRKGSGAFLGIVAAGIVSALALGLLVGGKSQMAMMVAVLMAVLVVTLAVLLAAAGRTRRRLARAVAAGECDWAAVALVLDGDQQLCSWVPVKMAPPGPKGTLTLASGILTWSPEKSTAARGYRETSWKVATSRVEKEADARDVTGIDVQTWRIVSTSGTVRLQLAMQTDALEPHLRQTGSREGHS